jgi:hypothetical protein
MECGSVHCQRFCNLKLLLAPALKLKKVCYACMVMHNIHEERQNNVIQFYIQQLYAQILLLNILSIHYGCLHLIKIPKTQVFVNATLCHWVGVTHPVFPCLDYLTQMTKALWTLGGLGNTHQTSITSKKAWIFSNNSDNLKSWIKCLSSL